METAGYKSHEAGDPLERRRVDWFEYDRELDGELVDRIEDELGIKMPWAFDDVEYVLGYKFLEEPQLTGGRPSAYIQVVRRTGQVGEYLGGVRVELVTNIPGDGSQWEDQRQQAVLFFENLTK